MESKKEVNFQQKYEHIASALMHTKMQQKEEIINIDQLH